MLASLKKAVGIKPGKKSTPYDFDAFVARFESSGGDRHRHGQQDKHGHGQQDKHGLGQQDRRPRQQIPPPWPSKWHLSCDIEWCRFPNPPCTVAGTHKCGDRACDGLFHVSPEFAAATAGYLRRRELHADLQNLPSPDKVFFDFCGQSARFSRGHKWQPPPSVRSRATAPVFVAFPRDPYRPYERDPMPRKPRPTQRLAHPSQNFAVPPRQGLPSQPVPS